MAVIENIWKEVQDLNEKIDALPGLMEIHGNQVKVITLDELSESLGLIKAGEFRVGDGKVPGDGFSGVRIGYPAFQYPSTSTASSDAYHIAGVDADTLMVGISATDGSLYFGGGAGWLNDSGLNLAVLGDSTESPLLKWIEPNDSGIKAVLTAFEVIGDSDNISLELLAGGVGIGDNPSVSQAVIAAISYHDSQSSSDGAHHIHQFLIQAGDSVASTLGDNRGSHQYFFTDSDGGLDVRHTIWKLNVSGESTGIVDLIWNADQTQIVSQWFGLSEHLMEVDPISESIKFGASDTSGWAEIDSQGMRHVGKQVESTTVDIAGDSTRRELFTTTVPGGLLGAGGAVVVKVFSQMDNQSGTTASMVHYLNWGDTFISDSGKSMTTATTRGVMYNFVLRSEGTMASQKLTGYLDETATVGWFGSTFDQPASDDLTLSMDMSWSSAHGALRYTFDAAVIEFIRGS